ncbi:MAG: hydrogenase maturation nickel metallochaperone HypA [Hyphomicrobiaceae bacterium]|nr:hydrogenase maturation nickel metallochaperone HypA [Hyphomicrobiaceae bacterium]
MHELAIAQGLMGEVLRVAAMHGANGVDLVVVRIGALAGVEPGLLERAFSVARAGTLASRAALEIEHGPLVVVCSSCGAETEARADRIVCGDCGDWKVRVVEGEEMLLVRVGLTGVGEAAPSEDKSEPPHLQM